MSNVKTNISNQEFIWNSLGIHELFRKKKIKKIMPVLIIVASSLAIFIAAALIIGNLWIDKNSKKGYYDGKTQEQIIADLNAQVAEGEMNVSIANTIKFPNGSLNEGDARIENIEANRVDQVVTIALKDSDEVLYESGAIQPGYFIQNISLNKNLEPGIYKAVALFTGYKHKQGNIFESIFSGKHEKTGAIATEINLWVE